MSNLVIWKTHEKKIILGFFLFVCTVVGQEREEEMESRSLKEKKSKGGKGEEKEKEDQGFGKKEEKEERERGGKEEREGEGERNYLAKEVMWGWFEQFVVEEERREGKVWEEGREVMMKHDLGLFLFCFFCFVFCGGFVFLSLCCELN